MPSCRCGIHAADFPFTFIHALQRSDILVKTVYENNMPKDSAVCQQLQITAGNQPLILQRNGENTAETAFLTQQVSQRPISAITFGHQRISRQVQGNGLITLHPKRIRHTAIGITHELTHQRGFPIQILIILQYHPLHTVPLHILYISQTIADYIPFERTHGILVRIGIFQRICIVKQIFGKRHIGCRQQFLSERHFHYRHNSIDWFRYLRNKQGIFPMPVTSRKHHAHSRSGKKKESFHKDKFKFVIGFNIFMNT